MRHLEALLKKEIKEDKNWILFGSLAFLLVSAFLISGSSRWTKGTATIAEFIILTVSIFVISVVRGFGLMKKELDSKTIYYLKSLPANGYEIALSKFLSFALEIGVLVTLALSINYGIFRLESLSIRGIGFRTFLLIYLSSFFSSLAFFSVPFIAYIAGKCTARLSKLLSIAVLLSLAYIIPKLHGCFVNILSFLPRLRLLNSLYYNEGGLNVHLQADGVSLASFIYFSAISLILVLIAGYLIEEKFEI